jgi:hypothetical protein
VSTDRLHIPMPEGFTQPDPPDDQALDEHAEWLHAYGHEATPETCFYCWYLARREAS